MFSTIDLSPRISTEIRADRKMLLDGAKAAQIRRLLEQRGVLVFRQINFDDQEQLVFSRTLGELADQGLTDRKLIKVSLDKEEQKETPYLADYLRGSFFWHIDGSADESPYLGSVLTAKRLSDTGGQTEFANTYAAYEALPEAEKATIAGLKVVHTLEASQRYVNPEPKYEELLGWQRLRPRVHPLVWTHRSGRKSLLLGSTATRIEDMDIEEGNLLLCHLREWATQPQFIYRHEWMPGDMIIWDNTGTMHRVTPYSPDSGRMMRRTTLLGEERVA